MASPDDPTIRLASPDDALAISSLYQEAYQGTYPDLLMRDMNLLRGFIEADGNIWVLAEQMGKAVASVVYETDPDHHSRSPEDRGEAGLQAVGRVPERTQDRCLRDPLP